MNKIKVVLFALLLLLFQDARQEHPLAQAGRLLDQGRLKDAEQIAREFAKLHTDSADAHYLLGLILFRQRKPSESLAEYTEAARHRTPQATDLTVVGRDYVLLEDYVSADRWFTKATEWEPTNATTLYYLGRTKYNENLFGDAVALFRRCLDLNPKDVKAESNLGLAYAGLGRTEEALAAYRTAIAWDADQALKNSDPYINLGTLLVEVNQAEQAVPFLIQGASISPDEVRAHRELGKAYKHLNQFEQAQSELERAIELAPRHAPTHFVLAQVYQARGLAEQARAERKIYTELTGAHSTP